jgi:hypothetical protein
MTDDSSLPFYQVYEITVNHRKSQQPLIAIKHENNSYFNLN